VNRKAAILDELRKANALIARVANASRDRRVVENRRRFGVTPREEPIEDSKGRIATLASRLDRHLTGRRIHVPLIVQNDVVMVNASLAPTIEAVRPWQKAIGGKQTLHDPVMSTARAHVARRTNPSPQSHRARFFMGPSYGVDCPARGVGSSTVFFWGVDASARVAQAIEQRPDEPRPRRRAERRRHPVEDLDHAVGGLNNPSRRCPTRRAEPGLARRGLGMRARERSDERDHPGQTAGCKHIEEFIVRCGVRAQL
jgi:hypothetical protein